ncbi:MAG: carboxypeptidase-like regulatory domain-containing protein, partial [Gemmatimonadota bacterium]|nr:carboxypeptidase-like regulatory domain-containing protein [Gemmatimonadota bacterium]
MELQEAAWNVNPAIHVARQSGRRGPGYKVAVFVLAMMAAGLSWVAPVSAQQTGTITGTVEDAETGEPLASAQISVPMLRIGVLSSGSGRFVLPHVPVGTHELRAERLGYATASVSVTVTVDAAATVELGLTPTVLGLAELVVTGTAFSESLVQLPYAVTVSSRRTLAEQGSPQAVDFF